MRLLETSRSRRGEQVKIDRSAGKPADPAILVNVPKLVTAYYEMRPDLADPKQRVVFGTSGHRGSALEGAFNEWHILAITQAICDYRKAQKIDGPLFLGMDTHALSEPAFASALEVLAANNIDVMLAEGTRYTPTPAVSHAILRYNAGRETGLADGIVITPSHNPPEEGGFKYDPPHAGPADSQVTSWIESRANEFLQNVWRTVKRVPFTQALRASTIHRYDYLTSYVGDLENVIDLEAIRASQIKLGVDWLVPHRVFEGNRRRTLLWPRGLRPRPWASSSLFMNIQFSLRAPSGKSIRLTSGVWSSAKSWLNASSLKWKAAQSPRLRTIVRQTT